MTSRDDLQQLMRTAAATPVLLLATDFDGTIAPFHNDPGHARPLPGAMDALASVAATPRSYAALVSGRDLATLAELSQAADNLTLIGSHGGESNCAAVSRADAITPEKLAILNRAWEGFTELQRSYPQARVERKAAAVVFHTRALPAEQQDPAQARAIEIAHDLGAMTPLFGKQVVECTILDATKGGALAALAAHIGATAVVYFGDDLTDETVFAQYRDDPDALMVKVGDGPTAANARVATASDAAQAIITISALRAEIALRRAPRGEHGRPAGAGQGADLEPNTTKTQ